MGGFFRKLKKKVKKVFKKTTGLIKKVVKSIGKAAKKVWGGIKKVVKKVGKVFTKLGPIASIGLSIFLPMAMPWLANYGVWGAMAKGAITGFVTSGGSLKGAALGAVGGGIGYAGSQGVSAFQKGWGTIPQSGTFSDKLSAGFKAVGRTTSEGVTNMFNSATNAVKSGSIKNLQYIDVSGDSIFRGAAKDNLTQAIDSGDQVAIDKARDTYFNKAGGGRTFVDSQGQLQRSQIGGRIDPEYVDPKTGQFSEDLYHKSLSPEQQKLHTQINSLSKPSIRLAGGQGAYIWDENLGDWLTPEGQALGDLGYGESNPYSYEYAISQGATPGIYNPKGAQAYKDYIKASGGYLPTTAGKATPTTKSKKKPSSLLSPPSLPTEDSFIPYQPDTSEVRSVEAVGTMQGQEGRFSATKEQEETQQNLLLAMREQQEVNRKLAQSGWIGA